MLFTFFTNNNRCHFLIISMSAYWAYNEGSTTRFFLSEALGVVHKNAKVREEEGGGQHNVLIKKRADVRGGVKSCPNL